MRAVRLILILFFITSLYNQTKETSKLTPDISEMYLISVSIGGGFIINGTFPASRTERADQFITRLYNEAMAKKLATGADPKFSSIINKYAEKYSFRNIKIKKADGSQKIIDLEKFRLTGDFNNNPYLTDGDLFIFSNYNENRTVTINGAISKPGTYEFVEGDKLNDLLLFAGGIEKTYSKISHIEISRLSDDGENEELIKAGLNENTELKAGDRIKVVASEFNKKDFKVLVLGEVNNPGYVYITKNNTKLKDVIERAGGFKETADLFNAEILRNYSSSEVLKKNAIETEIKRTGVIDFEKLTANDNKKEINEMLLMLRTNTLKREDTLAFTVDNKLRMFHNYSNVNLEELNIPGSEASNFLAKDGDVIVIPERQNKIYVYGQVARSGYYEYAAGKDYKYYLQLAGGITEKAIDSDEYVIIKSKSRQWINIEEYNPKIEPGDYLYIPRERERNFDYYMWNVAQAVGIISGIGTLILLIMQVGK